MFSVLDHLVVNEIPCFYEPRFPLSYPQKKKDIGQFSEPVEPNLSTRSFCLRPKPVNPAVYL